MATTTTYAVAFDVSPEVREGRVVATVGIDPESYDEAVTVITIQTWDPATDQFTNLVLALPDEAVVGLALAVALAVDKAIDKATQIAFHQGVEDLLGVR